MYLLDTNALSEPLRKRPSPLFMQRLADAREHRKFASAISVMELRYGCAHHVQGETLWLRIEREVLSVIELLPVDAVIARRAGEFMADVHRRGRPRSSEDLLVAATAAVHHLVVVTHNTSDFDDIHGVRVEDWMDSPRG